MMSLSAHPISSAAESFIEAVRAQVQAWEDKTGRRRRDRRQVSFDKQTTALGTILGSLLFNWLQQQPKASYRSLKKEEFTGEPVAFRIFESAIQALIGAGLIHRQKARRSPKEVFASRYWPTQALIDLAALHHLTSDTLRQHFRPHAPAIAPRIHRPIRLTELKRWDGRGRTLVFDPSTPEAQAIIQRVNAMNRLAADIDVQGCLPPRWFRSFTLDWQHHGRWYAGGDESYQQLPQEERLQITIGGEAVAELDISASHLTLLHGLLGLPAPTGDAYEVDGVPRFVAKAWINATIGKGSPVNCWAKKTLKQSPELADFSPREVGQAVMRRYPFLADPAAILKDTVAGADPRKLLPHRLMAIEASIMSQTMQELANKDILALPMHDGLIVPRNALGLAEEILRRAGLSAGVQLKLKIDYPAPTVPISPPG